MVLTPLLTNQLYVAFKFQGFLPQYYSEIFNKRVCLYLENIEVGDRHTVAQILASSWRMCPQDCSSFETHIQYTHTLPSHPWNCWSSQCRDMTLYTLPCRSPITKLRRKRVQGNIHMCFGLWQGSFCGCFPINGTHWFCFCFNLIWIVQRRIWVIFRWLFGGV